jgi:uncharacterized protein YlxW (UPF0749 family)
MTQMFDRGFDPYDALIAMDIKMQQLTDAHNQMARAFEQKSNDLDVLLTSHQHLQASVYSVTQSIQALSHVIEDLQRQITEYQAKS